MILCASTGLHGASGCVLGNVVTAGRTIFSGRGSTRSSTMNHALARLGRAIDWRFVEARCGSVYTDAPGHPPLPTRLMAGLAIPRSMHDLSDEALCDHWVENSYYQLFSGEEFFRHDLPFDLSSMTRWRQRMTWLSPKPRRRRQSCAAKDAASRPNTHAVRDDEPRSENSQK